MAFLFSFHIFQLISILQIVGVLGNSVPSKEALIGVGSILPVSILLAIIIKEKRLEELEEKYWDQWDRVFNASAWLIVYAILSFSAIWVLLHFARR
jgi:hypothetical protein